MMLAKLISGVLVVEFSYISCTLVMKELLESSVNEKSIINVIAFRRFDLISDQLHCKTQAFW